MAPTLEPTTMSASMPRAASACIMPTWMAPKLPPPASTKAVLGGPACRGGDKDVLAPRTPRHGAARANLAPAYSRETESVGIKNGCVASPRGRREARAVAYRLPLHERLFDHEVTGLAVAA